LRLWDGLLGWDWVGEFFHPLHRLVENNYYIDLWEYRQRTSQVRSFFQYLP
jgi:hypothetical protein